MIQHQWIELEKNALALVMERHGIKWLQKGTHNKHLLVLDFEKRERAKEVSELDARLTETEKTLQDASRMVDYQLARVEKLVDMGEKAQKENEMLLAENSNLEKAYIATKQSYNVVTAKNSLLQSENEELEQEKENLQSGNQKLEQQRQKLQKEIESMAASKAKLERNVRSYDEDEKWLLPDVGIMQTAKAYRDKSALSLVNKLKELVKSLTIKCIGLVEQVRKLTGKVEKQGADIEWYKRKIK